MSTPTAMPESDMPQLFQAANSASRDGQRQHISLIRWRLLLLGGAAVLGITSWRVGPQKIDILAAVAVALFVWALVVELWLWRARPDKAWYDGRAVAESVKTLAWKFAVGGGPFPKGMPTKEATLSWLDLVASIREQFPELDLTPVDAPAISPWMVELRASSFAHRRETYIRARIKDQKAWYADKAAHNRRMAKRWRSATAGLEAAGALSSLVEAFVRTGVLLAPALAAVAGAVVAWIGVKQHDTLARAYSAAVTDLVSAESKLDLVKDEQEWMTEVDDAEEAISREHTVWLASRSRI